MIIKAIFLSTICYRYPQYTVDYDYDVHGEGRAMTDSRYVTDDTHISLDHSNNRFRIARWLFKKTYVCRRPVDPFWIFTVSVQLVVQVHGMSTYVEYNAMISLQYIYIYIYVYIYIYIQCVLQRAPQIIVHRCVFENILTKCIYIHTYMHIYIYILFI